MPDRRRQTNKTTGTADGREAGWDAFHRQFAGHPQLQKDYVYALPATLIDAICKHVPGLFSKDDVRFEKELVKHAGAGFFMKQSFWPRCSQAPNRLGATRK